jgi:hypothetical protein
MSFISLQSLNFPDRFIRHQNFLGELTPIQSELDRQDATFALPDSAAPGDAVQIHSVNFTSHVLRHEGFRIKLHEFNPPLTPPPPLGRPETPEERRLREDSTFVLVAGLADATAVSFRSFNFPDRFIRHRDFHLQVEPVNDDLSRHDATFRVVAPFVPPPPPPIVH